MTKKASEGAVPVQEIQTPTVIPVRHFMRSAFLIGLVVICIAIGILFHRLNNPIYPKQTVSPVRVTRELSVAGDRTEIPTRVRLPHPVREVSMIDELPPTQPTEPIINQSPATIEPLNHALATVQSKNEAPLSLITALQLRDKLAMGESCRQDVENLLNAPVATVHPLLEKLIPVCVQNDFWKTLEKTFQRDKQEALITYYHLNNPMWLAYIKSFLVRMIDIQRIHPTKMRPKDFLAQAQEAMIQHRLDTVIANIQKLPPVLQAHFRDFLKQAQTYLAAQETVEKIILSFDEGRK